MTEMKGKNVKFGAVDVMQNKDLAIAAKIRRAPTIFVYGNNKHNAVEYEGDRKQFGVVKYM